MDKKDQTDIKLFLKHLQLAVLKSNIEWLKHSLQRMMERNITRKEVKTAILKGSVIEVYSDDRPYPSILIAWIEDKPLHVVVSYDEVEDMCYIITAYVPDEKYFEKDLITRRIK